jgi:rod shape-determining protein MreD
MSVNAPHRRWIIVLTFIVALILEIMPLPEWVGQFRPDWVVLTLVYWCMALPNRVGILTGWSSGLILDVIEGTLLGQHAFAFALIAFLSVRLAQRVRVFPLRQQALTILLFLIFYQLVLLWIMGLSGNNPNTTWYFLPSLVGTLLWPWLYIILRDTRRRFRVR